MDEEQKKMVKLGLFLSEEDGASMWETHWVKHYSGTWHAWRIRYGDTSKPLCGLPVGHRPDAPGSRLPEPECCKRCLIAIWEAPHRYGYGETGFKNLMFAALGRRDLISDE